MIGKILRQHKFFFSLLGLSFLLFSLGIAYGGRKVYELEKRGMHDKAGIAIQAAHDVVGALIADLAEELHFLANLHDFRDYIDKEFCSALCHREIEAILARFSAAHPRYRAMGIVDLEGNERLRVGGSVAVASSELLASRESIPGGLFLLPVAENELPRVWRLGIDLVDSRGQRKGFLIASVDNRHFMAFLPRNVSIATSTKMTNPPPGPGSHVEEIISDEEAIHYARADLLPGRDLLFGVSLETGSLKSAMLRLTLLFLFLFSSFFVLLFYISLNKISRFREQIQAQRTMVFALANLAEWRDPETGAHLERTRNYGVLLARVLHRNPAYEQIISREFIEDLHDAAPMHDIGKVGIPDAILLKPGPLSPEEFEVMKRHAQIGRDLLQKVIDELQVSESFLRMSRNIAACHHEKFDGTGYPDGLAGEAIPLEARIFGLCDAYDAIRSKRPYKDEVSHEEAIRRLTAGRGRHFDPEVVEAFLACEEEFMEIHETYSLFDQACGPFFPERCNRTLTVEWSAEMALGIPEIDCQHQELIALVNSLFRAVLEGRGKETANAALVFLEDYILIHFATEERFMAETGYPSLKEHCRLHQVFIHDFKELVAEFKNDGNSSRLVVQINQKVVHWLIEHIMKVDKQLARASLPSAVESNGT